MPALKVESLSKSFGSRQAVRAVSFTVETGETVAFLGPNGAGKSTTLRMIAGFLEPDAGDALINGVSILSDRTRAQLSLGYLAEGAPLYTDLSVRNFLGFLARTHGLTRNAAHDAIARVAEDAAIVSSLIQLAHSLNLTVVAEGVETQEQFDYLKAQKCDRVQGFYFSRPVAPDAVPGLLKA